MITERRVCSRDAAEPGPIRRTDGVSARGLTWIRDQRPLERIHPNDEGRKEPVVNLA